MSFNESIRAHFIVAGGQVTQKIQEGERANLQFRTTFLNVEHFYDDQFRKRGEAKKGNVRKRRVKRSWETHFLRSFKFWA